MREIDISGFFWIADNENIKIRGKLTALQGKKISLTLEGSFTNSENSKGLSFNNPILKRYDCILGETAEGDKFTLIKCFENGNNKKFKLIDGEYREYNTSHFTAEKLIAGGHFNSLNDLKFSEITFRYSNLENWVNANNFTWDFGKNDENLYTIKYGFEPYKPATLIDGTSIKIETWSPSFRSEIAQSEINLVERDFISISAEEELPLEKLLEKLYIMEFFLTLCIGNSQNLIEVFLYTKEEEPQTSYRGSKDLELIIPMKLKDVKPLKYHDMLIDFQQIKDDFTTIMENWHDKYEKLKDIWDLFFAIHLQSDMYLQPKFVLLTQLLESYHRRVYDIDRTAQKEERDRVIMSQTNEEIKKYLKQKLEHAHEPSFKERYNDLFSKCKGLNNILRYQMAMDKETFLSYVATSRNYYTHYDEKLKKKVPNTNILFFQN